MITLRGIGIFFLLHFYSASYCQIDPHKLDSLSNAIDSSVKNREKWQDSFTKTQDSIYKTTVDKNTNQLKQDKEVENKKRQESIVRIIIGVLFCAGLITGFAIRKKPKS